MHAGRQADTVIMIIQIKATPWTDQNWHAASSYKLCIHYIYKPNRTLDGESGMCMVSGKRKVTMHYAVAGLTVHTHMRKQVFRK